MSIKKANLTFIVTGSSVIFTPLTRPVSFKTDGTDAERVVFDTVFFNNSVVKIEGRNEFNVLRTNRETRIPLEQKIKDLRLDGGARLILQSSRIQEVENIYATGTCDAPVIIESTWSGKNAIIQTTGPGGDYQLQDTYLESITLDASNGTPTFGTFTHYDLSGNNGWTAASTAVGASFVWNGNDGDWHNPLNWLRNGVATTCIPSPIDDVEFTNSSFNSTNQALNITEGNAYCKDFIFDNVPDSTDIKSISAIANKLNNLNIYGSFELLPNMGVHSAGNAHKLSFNGNIYFKSHTAGNLINTNGVELQAYIYFNGVGGEWMLDEDLTTSLDIQLTGGSFNSNGRTVNANIFGSTSRNTRELIMGASTFNVDRWSFDSNRDEFNSTTGYLYTLDPNFTLSSGQSTINVNGSGNAARMGYFFNYNNININNLTAKPTVGLTGCTVNKLKLNSASVITFKDTCTITDSIVFTKGKSYSIIEGTFELESQATLVANGDCSGLIDIDGGTFVKNGGNAVTVDYCILENCNAVGSVNFTANNSIFNNTTGWIEGTVRPSNELHFKASSTDATWSEPFNWYDTYNPTTKVYSNSPGYTPCSPSPFDDVVFHPNSFDALSTPRIEVFVLNAYCRSMTWEDPNGTSYPNPEVQGTNTNGQHNSQTLNVFGSLNLQDDTEIDWIYPGTTHFRSHGASPSSRTFNPENQEFKDNIFIQMDTLDTLVLTNDLRVVPAVYVGTISLSSGTFDISNQSITCYIYSSSFYTPRSFIAANSTINCIQAFSPALNTTAAANLTMVFDNTDIFLGNRTEGYNNGGGISGHGIDYRNANIEFGSTTNINGSIGGSDNTFGNVEFTQGGNIYGDHSFLNLLFTDGETYFFEAGKTQTIRESGSFEASGTNGQPITIESTSDNNHAFFNSQVPVCLDYIEMRDINGTYIAPNPILTHALIAGENSVNGSNNEGFAFTNCIPDTLESCVGENIVFDFISSPCQTVWNFGDGTPLDSSQNPVHSYSAAGTYFVKVSYGTPCGLIGHDPNDEASTDSRNYVIVVEPSCCDTLDFPDHITVSGDITSNTIWSDKIYVIGSVYVKQGANLDITNTDVVFSNNTRIVVEDNSSLIVNNSTLRSCNLYDLWLGLLFEDNSTGRINNNIIINGDKAVRLRTEGIVDVVGNQFTNCFNGIYADQVSDTIELNHLFSNNVFTMNRDLSSIANVPSYVYGIKLINVNLKNSISLNNFNYGIEGEEFIGGYGIYQSQSSTDVSDNTFVNVWRAYTQSHNTGVCSFDNNEVYYNNAFDLTYNISSIIGASITNSSSLSTALNNTVSSSNPIPGSHGIHTTNGSNVLISGNTIERFHYCVWSGNSESVEISNNEINDAYYYSIYVDDSYYSILVKKNIIKRSGSRAVRTKYRYNNSTATAEYSDNCILECSRGLEFVSQIAGLALPVIKNNYLYNYSTGIVINNFSGSIGTTGNHGKNTLISIGGGTDVTLSNSTVTTYGNYPKLLATNGGQFLDQIDEQTSTSVCGNQNPFLRKLGFKSETYFLNKYGLSFTNETANYSAKTFEKLNTTQNVYLNAVVIVNTLLHNDVPTNAQNFVNEVNTRFDFNKEEKAWLNYLLAKNSGNWAAATNFINQVNTLDIFDNGDLATEKLQLQLYKTNRTLFEISAEEKKALYSIYESTENIFTRSLIHIIDNNHPYIFETDDTDLENDLLSASFTSLTEKLTVYPNPTKGELNLKFKVLPNVESTVQIIDMYGRILQINSIPPLQSKFTFNLEGLKSGMYYLKITNDQGEFEKSFQVIN